MPDPFRKSRRERKIEQKISKSIFPGFSLIDHIEEMFVDYSARKRVYRHPVPAPWSRVIVFAILYAVLLNTCRVFWFEIFGRPEIEPSVPLTRVSD